MSEIVPTSNKKEAVPSSIQCPMLNSTNYTAWAMKMRLLLRVHKVWDTIDPGSTDIDKNDLASALIFQSVSESLMLQLGHLDTTKAVWDAIKTRNLGAERVKEARLQTLMVEFDRLTMKETDTIDDFVGKLSEISSKATSLGESIEETKIVKKFLKSLPMQKYIQISATLEQVLDLKTTSFEDIIGRIKTYEERISAAEVSQENQGKLMYANSESSSSGHDQEGGQGRGRGGYRGRGRAQEDQEKAEDDTQEAESLMMHEVVFLNEKNVIPKELEASSDKVWYLDNGASNHMSGNHTWFKTIDTTITGKVRFGDDSRVDIKGKGSILFLTKGGQRKVLTDVYYIPDLKSNIISLGQATESGCDVRMREDYLTLHDREGNLLVKANRSRNRLYKVDLEVERIKLW
ncbi:uncharacterized protein LOC111829953 [Capsella rubella]|uniref:uncharacterized protein LOC111829953 n=1 Tax=Capsella rubella TaxID=81985 RepID=UPI000CD58FBD|nr:uncharacterized protein LOC111829953 [Capsella rubella]